jgi:hypothetical protein
MEHEFTPIIRKILSSHFSDAADEVFEKSSLVRYLNNKTKSASRGSKSRGSFANHYAVYVLVEDYISKGFADDESAYSDYEGAVYTDLFARMRELPFGQKLQNHALNNRMNDEFKKFFPDVPHQPIIRDLKTKKYWVNENLLKISIGNETYNIASAILEIINSYIEMKRAAFEKFISYTSELTRISEKDVDKVVEFITQQIQPNIDARVFEIVSYAILKSYYAGTVIYWGWDPGELNEDSLKLYKTGRTNANDGGIDFVMKPLGRIFQVTETLDFKKYFLDIDKIQRYPITFVIKTDLEEKDIYSQLKANALSMYGIKAVVKRYMDSIEEIINIPKLEKIFQEQVQREKVKEILAEIVLQSKVEFGYE